MYDRLLWWTDPLSVCRSLHTLTDECRVHCSTNFIHCLKDTVHIHSRTTTSRVASGSSLNLRCASLRPWTLHTRFASLDNFAIFSLMAVKMAWKFNRNMLFYVFLLSAGETCPLKPPDSECVQVKPHYLHGQVPLETMEKTCFHWNLKAAGQDIKYFMVKDLCFNYKRW